jgi:hypothetical protein
MVQACFLEEPLEVVDGWSRLALAAACGPCGALHARATHSLVGASVVIGCGLLAVLLAPLLTGIGSLLGSLEGDIGHRRPVAS